MTKENKLLEIYNMLLKEYGPQGWWPVTPRTCNIDPKPIYGLKASSEKQKLEIIFGAVVVQNTAWKNAEKAIINLYKNDLIDINNIIKIDNEKLSSIIKSAGYYNEKAKKLKNVSLFLKKYPIKVLQKMDLKKARELLLSVNGIGPETADSIMLYTLEKPIFVVDAYTKRILVGLNLIEDDASYDEIQDLFMKNLKLDVKMFKEYHALLVEHTKRYYSTKPYGEYCFLKHKII